MGTSLCTGLPGPQAVKTERVLDGATRCVSSELRDTRFYSPFFVVAPFSFFVSEDPSVWDGSEFTSEVYEDELRVSLTREIKSR